jgi:hypothetical protein
MKKIVERLHYAARLQYFDQDKELLDYEDVTRGDIWYDGLLILPVIFADRRYIKPGTYNGSIGGVVYYRNPNGSMLPAINIETRELIVPNYNEGHAYISFYIPKNKKEIVVWVSERSDFKYSWTKTIDLTTGF